MLRNAFVALVPNSKLLSQHSQSQLSPGITLAGHGSRFLFWTILNKNLFSVGWNSPPKILTVDGILHPAHTKEL